MQDFKTTIARRYLQTTARLELDALDNAISVLRNFRYSDSTACHDGFLSAESVVALKECDEAIAALRTLLYPPRSTSSTPDTPTD